MAAIRMCHPRPAADEGSLEDVLLRLAGPADDGELQATSSEPVRPLREFGEVGCVHWVASPRAAEAWLARDERRPGRNLMPWTYYVVLSSNDHRTPAVRL